MSKGFRLCIMFILILSSSGCDAIVGEVSLDTYVLPLTISIATNGDVTFRVNSGVSIPTPIGVVSAGVIIDPSSHYDLPNTLTVRLNGEDHFYDLHGQDFEVNVESGYYEVVKISKSGRDLFVELSSQNIGESSDEIEIPVYENWRFEPTSGYSLDLTIEKIIVKDEIFEVYFDAIVYLSSDFPDTESLALDRSCLERRNTSGFSVGDFTEHKSSKVSLAIDTNNQAKGYALFQRSILKDGYSYTFCLACESYLCTGDLPIQ